MQESGRCRKSSSALVLLASLHFTLCPGLAWGAWEIWVQIFKLILTRRPFNSLTRFPAFRPLCGWAKHHFYNSKTINKKINKNKQQKEKGKKETQYPRTAEEGKQSSQPQSTGKLKVISQIHGSTNKEGATQPGHGGQKTPAHCTSDGSAMQSRASAEELREQAGLSGDPQWHLQSQFAIYEMGMIETTCPRNFETKIVDTKGTGFLKVLPSVLWVLNSKVEERAFALLFFVTCRNCLVSCLPHSAWLFSAYVFRVNCNAKFPSYYGGKKMNRIFP